MQRAGAMRIASGRCRLVGAIAFRNSVLGTATDAGASMNFDYDDQHHLAAGRPSENIVRLFTMDQVFADPLEQSD